MIFFFFSKFARCFSGRPCMRKLFPHPKFSLRAHACCFSISLFHILDLSLPSALEQQLQPSSINSHDRSLSGTAGFARTISLSLSSHDRSPSPSARTIDLQPSPSASFHVLLLTFSTGKSSSLISHFVSLSL
jgi:hypothetical protein